MSTEIITRNDLATKGMDALDRDRVGKVSVSAQAGGITFASAIEVMEFAKLLSTAGTAIPKHLRANAGGCLAITFQAIEWRMSPISVANKSYEVNDRIAYESQLLHAVIESRAPLKERLDCKYDGIGPDRTCTVTGKFIDGTERSYTSPAFKDIRVKNSPLWKDDPDQQLFYYSSRSWARKWCPDVLLGIYTREEMEASPTIGREEEPAGPNMRERLGSTDTGEGHKTGHVEGELAHIAPHRGQIIEVEANKEPEAGKDTGKPAASKTAKEKKAKADKKEPATTEPAKAAEQPSGDQQKDTPAQPIQEPDGQPATGIKAAQEPEPATQQAKQPAAQPAEPPRAKPKTAQEYQAWAYEWLLEATDVAYIDHRWGEERTLRNACGLTSELRQPIEDKKHERRAELKAEGKEGEK